MNVKKIYLNITTKKADVANRKSKKNIATKILQISKFCSDLRQKQIRCLCPAGLAQCSVLLLVLFADLNAGSVTERSLGTHKIQ